MFLRISYLFLVKNTYFSPGSILKRAHISIIIFFQTKCLSSYINKIDISQSSLLI